MSAAVDKSAVAPRGEAAALGRLLSRACQRGCSMAMDEGAWGAAGRADAQAEAKALVAILRHARPARLAQLATRALGEVCALPLFDPPSLALVARELAAAGADPNARGPRGLPPLAHLAGSRAAGAIEELLAAGADPLARWGADARLPEDRAVDPEAKALLRAWRERAQLAEAKPEVRAWLVDLSSTVEGSDAPAKRAALWLDLAPALARRMDEAERSNPEAGHVEGLSAKSPRSPLAQRAMCSAIFQQWPGCKGASAQDLAACWGDQEADGYASLFCQRVSVERGAGSPPASRAELLEMGSALARAAGAARWFALDGPAAEACRELATQTTWRARRAQSLSAMESQDKAWAREAAAAALALREAYKLSRETPLPAAAPRRKASL